MKRDAFEISDEKKKRKNQLGPRGTVKSIYCLDKF